jgi:hypothetical protein
MRYFRSRRKPVAVLLAAAFLYAASVSGCHRAQSPQQVEKDVAAARQKAAEQKQEAQRSAESKIASARADVQSHLRDAEHVTAEQTGKVAEAEAEGAYKVALAECERLSGDAQKSCRDKAEADYQVAKTRAEQRRALIDSRP